MNVDISGLKTEVTEKQKKYINKKIGNLEKYVPVKQRASTRVEVRLKEHKIEGQKQLTCTVLVHLPSETIKISETTINAFAAVDIVETKLKLALKKYKDKHASPKFRQKLTARWLGR